MCGRFILKTSLVRLQAAFGFAERPNLPARYNIAPTQEIAIVRPRREGQRELALVQWGLIPFWAKDARFGSRCINARAETVATAPAFREAFQRRRALILADGFYEWRKLEPPGIKPSKGMVKQPVLIRRHSGEPFAFAGLWERWKGPEGEVQTATIITTHANASLAAIHDRMPVILDPASYDRWLDPARPQAQELLRPCPDDWLEAVPVSARVNSPKNDDADLLTPLAA
jgi:putative SOS response-associated peptidase YedK